MKIAVIISTYNSPEWLEKVLWGYSVQDYSDFDIIICDDGSGPETKALIDQLRSEIKIPITHEWHEAPDYQRQKILNQCIRNTRADYLIFTDGDCIPRKDFIRTHAQHAEKGYFLSGGYCKLPMSLSKSITKEDILSHRCFNPNYLLKHGLVKISPWLKLLPGPRCAQFFNKITPTKATWNNCNSSAFRKDIVAVNGFDERMKYGGSDRELGERLWNYGLKSKQIRYRAICLHLDHARGYATPESIAFNHTIRNKTITKKIIRTPYGIEKERSLD